MEGGWIEVVDEAPPAQIAGNARVEAGAATTTTPRKKSRGRALPTAILGAVEPDAEPETSEMLMVAAQTWTLTSEIVEDSVPAESLTPEPMPEPLAELTSYPHDDELPARESDDDGADDDMEPSPAPRPLPDEPIHPEREPAPIEHPEEPSPKRRDEPDDDDAMDVGTVVMEEADQETPTVAGTQQAVVTQQVRMPLSQEMPAKGDIASGLSLPEQFLLVAYQPGWDDAMERARPGAQGAAIVGSLLLELALRGAVKVQRGRFAVEDAGALPPELAAFAGQLRQLGPVTTQVAMERLAKGLPDRIRPWVQALERRGVLREERTRKLGVLARSQLFLLDESAKDKLENRLVRTLAGGGNPDARTIMLLGLVSASGLLRELVPSSAYDFNRKRIQALLSGRDTLSYRVDNSIRRVQDLALQTVLGDIRVLQGT